ncbi:MAG: hypothetical protein ACNA7V_03425, partial [Bacteroidales bacterium]
VISKPEVSVEATGNTGLDQKPSKSRHFNGENSSPASYDCEKDEIEKKSRERIQRLKELSIKIRTPQEIDEMERTPAYIRRNIELPEVKHSSEQEAATYTLGEGDDHQGEIKSNNSFLHKNVD